MSTRDYTPLRAEPKSFPKKDDGTLFANAQDRLNKGYHEVCFGYLLAKFASLQQAELGGCIAGIATNGPKFYNNATVDKFDLVSLRNWIGKLPKYDVNGNPTANGSGVLGIPYLVGCTAAKLNSLCAEYVTGKGYRLPGFFENDLGEYDGGVNFDKNGHLDLVLFAARCCRVGRLLPRWRPVGAAPARAGAASRVCYAWSKLSGCESSNPVSNVAADHRNAFAEFDNILP